MALDSISEIDGMVFETLHPRDISRPARDTLLELKREHYKEVLGDEVTPAQLDNFVGDMGDSFENPNVSVGSRYFSGQRYSKQRVTVAYRNDMTNAEGYVYAAFNASSSLDVPERFKDLPGAASLAGLARQAEILAKLNIPHPKFESRRYLTVMDMVPVSSVLGFVALERADDDTHVTVYPMKREMLLLEAAKSWGMTETGRVPVKDEHAFGPGTQDELIRLAATAGTIRSALLSREGFRAVIGTAIHTHTVR